MKIKYHPDADALAIKVGDEKPDHGEQIGEKMIPSQKPVKEAAARILQALVEMVNCVNKDTGIAAPCGCASPAGDGCSRLQIIMTGLTADIEHQNRHVMEEVLYRMRKGGIAG